MLRERFFKLKLAEPKTTYRYDYREVAVKPAAEEVQSFLEEKEPGRPEITSIVSHESLQKLPLKSKMGFTEFVYQKPIVGRDPIPHDFEVWDKLDVTPVMPLGPITTLQKVKENDLKQKVLSDMYTTIQRQDYKSKLQRREIPSENAPITTKVPKVVSELPKGWKEAALIWDKLQLRLVGNRDKRWKSVPKYQREEDVEEKLERLEEIDEVVELEKADELSLAYYPKLNGYSGHRPNYLKNIPLRKPAGSFSWQGKSTVNQETKNKFIRKEN